MFMHAPLQCMKRPNDSLSMAIPPKKKIKNKQSLNNTLATPNMALVENCHEYLIEKYRRLLFLQEETRKLAIQIFYINAIQEKNTHKLWHALAYGPKQSCLHLAVGLQFTEGIDIILKHTQPTVEELEESLQMAIIHQNVSLMHDLLKIGVRLNIFYSRIHLIIQKVFRENIHISNIFVQHNMKLIDAVKMELETIVASILQKNKPDQSELNECIKIATQQKNNVIINLLTQINIHPQ